MVDMILDLIYLDNFHGVLDLVPNDFIESINH
jgi:hypothetical protein